MEVTCDKCGQIRGAYNVTMTRIIAEEKDGNVIAQQYWDCDKCHTRHTIIITDNEVRERIKRIRTLQAMIVSAAELGSYGDQSVINEISFRCDKESEEVKKRSHALEGRYWHETRGGKYDYL